MRRSLPLDVVGVLTLMTAVGLLLLTTLAVSAQEQPVQIWNTTCGDTGYDVGSGVAVDNDIYVVGTLDYFGLRAGDAFLAKYDIWRTQLWNTTWGGSDSDVGSGVTVGSDIYVVGTTASFGAGSRDAFLAKYDGDGHQIWNTTWGGPDDDWAYGVAVSGEAVYITGETASFGAGFVDAFVVRFDGDGYQVWNATWGGSGGDEAGYGVAVNSEAIYVTGQATSFNVGFADAFVVRFDGDGHQIWNATWGGDDDDWGLSVAVGSDIYVTGRTASFGAGFVDAFVVRFDGDGYQVWNATWGGPDDDWAYGVAVSGEAVYITGETASFGAGSGDAFLAKYDVEGVQLWNVTWGGQEGDSGYGVAVGSDVYVVGNTASFAVGDIDAFLVRYGFLPVGGVVIPISPVERLLCLVIAVSIGALLVVAKTRQKTPRGLSSTT